LRSNRLERRGIFADLLALRLECSDPADAIIVRRRNRAVEFLRDAAHAAIAGVEAEKDVAHAGTCKRGIPPLCSTIEERPKV
jgi:hypothetical protein